MDFISSAPMYVPRSIAPALAAVSEQIHREHPELDFSPENVRAAVSEHVQVLDIERTKEKDRDSWILMVQKASQMDPIAIGLFTRVANALQVSILPMMLQIEADLRNNDLVQQSGK